MLYKERWRIVFAFAFSYKNSKRFEYAKRSLDH